jgi:ribosomal protein S15P/S13E
MYSRITRRHRIQTKFVVFDCVIFVSPGPFAEKSVFCTESTGEFRYIARSLQAYLCAGVFDWASEMLDTHNGAESVAALSGENGAVNEDTVRCEGCQNKSEQWHGLLDVLKLSKIAVLTRENIQYFQDCVKIKKWEHEIATTFAKSQTPTGDTLGTFNAAGDGDDTESLLQKLEELKQHKEAFQRDYISTPNPFIIHCKIKTILFHIKKEDPQTCGDLYEQFEALWKSITSHI